MATFLVSQGWLLISGSTVIPIFIKLLKVHLYCTPTVHHHATKKMMCVLLNFSNSSESLDFRHLDMVFKCQSVMESALEAIKKWKPDLKVSCHNRIISMY